MVGWRLLRARVRDLAVDPHILDQEVLLEFMEMVAELREEEPERIDVELRDWVWMIKQYRPELARILMGAMYVIASCVQMEIEEPFVRKGPPLWRIAEQERQGFLVPDQPSNVVKGSGLDPEDAAAMTGIGITGF